MRYQDLIKTTDYQDKKILELLLCDYFKVLKQELITNEVCNIDIEKYTLMVSELKQGKPYQYVVGYTNFYGRDFKVNANVLIPRFETEGLVEEVLLKTADYFPTPKILDLCTGSGIIAITLSKELNIQVDASDISNDALEVAKKNAKELKADVTLIESDLFANINKKYNIIVSNPPYIMDNEELPPSVKDYEPHLALYAGKKGLDIYERILKEVSTYLEEKYLIAFEIGMTQADDITILVKRYLKDVLVEVKQDLQGRNRYLFVIHV